MRMRRPNVVLLVVDTLREDHAGPLDELLGMGFVRYSNAIAPSPWTLPSHVSMFTGLNPGAHGVHESYSGQAALAESAVEGMRRLGHGVLGELMDEGYSSYFLTANLYITPHFGFERYTEHLVASPYLPEALEWGRFSRLVGSLFSGGGYVSLARDFLSVGEGGLLARAILRGIRLRMGLGMLDKGSRALLRALEGMELSEPFLLFVNLMEAHEPYTPGDLSGALSSEASFSSIFEGRVPDRAASIWRRQYPRHARAAADRALEFVRALGRLLRDSVVIVTSDHGQLIGDGGIGHGYFLSDGLLRVPLYVRWPDWMDAPRQVGRYVSLAQVPSMIRSAMEGRSPGLGSDVAIAESFGPVSLPRDWRRRVSRGAAREAFSHRVKVYVRGGSFTYNASADRLEEAVGVDRADAYAALRRLELQQLAGA